MPSLYYRTYKAKEIKMKRDIDKLRDGPKVFEVKDSDDQTPILMMVPTLEGLYSVRGKSIYLTRLADKIDPERTNIEVPDVHQKTLSYGMEQKIVSRILGTAHNLFSGNFLKAHISIDSAMSEAMRFTCLLCEMKDQTDKITKEIHHFLERGINSGGSKGQIIPYTPDLKNSIDAFIRKADFLRQGMIDLLIKIYKPSSLSKKKGYLETIQESIIARHGDGHAYAIYYKSFKNTLSFLRNFRNNWEHPNEESKVILKDFDIYADGHIHVPCIQLVDPKTPQPEMDLTVFMGQMVDELTEQCEIFIGNLCSANASFGDFETTVLEIPEEKRRFSGARLGYAVLLNGEWQLMG